MAFFRSVSSQHNIIYRFALSIKLLPINTDNDPIDDDGVRGHLCKTKKKNLHDFINSLSKFKCFSYIVTERENDLSPFPVVVLDEHFDHLKIKYMFYLMNRPIIEVNFFSY